MKAHALVAGLIGALLLAQAGATPRMGSSSPSGRALDQITNSVTRPVPTLPPPTGQLPSDVWVPDRIVPVPDQPGGLIVPGHWERRLSDHQNYVPPLAAGPHDRLVARHARRAQVVRVVDLQDRVLLHDAEQDEDAERGIEVERVARPPQREERERDRERQREQDGERVDHALELRGED